MLLVAYVTVFFRLMHELTTGDEAQSICQKENQVENSYTIISS